MIYIRYRDISSGLHAEAEHGLHGVVVYLLPGLTPAQRQAALRRLRQEGSRGCGPRLPAGQLAVALAMDRLRAAVTHTAAAVRHHPIGTLLPPLLASGLMAGFGFAAVFPGIAPAEVPGTPGAASWSVPHAAPGRGGPGAAGPAAAASDSAWSAAIPRKGAAAGTVSGARAGTLSGAVGAAGSAVGAGAVTEPLPAFTSARTSDTPAATGSASGQPTPGTGDDGARPTPWVSRTGQAPATPTPPALPQPSSEPSS